MKIAVRPAHFMGAAVRSILLLAYVIIAIIIPNDAEARALSQAEVSRLIAICLNIPRGRIPQPPPLRPGSKEATQCHFFEPVYKSCGTMFGMSMLFGKSKFTPEMLRKCLRTGYNG